MNLSFVVDIATVVGVCVGLVTLILATVRFIKEMQLSRKVNQGNFWLELERMFSKHDEVHMNLRPGGKWNFYINSSFEADLNRRVIPNALVGEFKKNGLNLSDTAAVYLQNGDWLIDDIKSGKQYFVTIKNSDTLNVLAHSFAARQWAAIEDYMGLFEHCMILLDKKMLDWDTFIKIFAYRCTNIIHNRHIVEVKLVEMAHGWTDFITLLRELNQRYPEKWRSRLKGVKQMGVRLS